MKPHSEEWSETDSHVKDQIVSTEWKAKLPVSEKVGLLQVEDSRSVEG